MSELHDALLGGVLNANEVVLDAEERTQRWARQRSHLARVAYMNGVSIDEIATSVGQPSSVIRDWVGSDEGERSDCNAI